MTVHSGLVLFTAVHEAETLFLPDLNQVPLSVGAHTHMKLGWELRERLPPPHGNCVTGAPNVSRHVSGSRAGNRAESRGFHINDARSFS